jgi:HK97 family phage prohead protease
MEHLLLKATTVAADEGTFEAVISTGSVDREGDVIEPNVMVAALQKWATIGKLIPLAWNHTDEVIGHIDPASARAEGTETIAKGYIDQSIPRGEEAWRLVKSGTLSFSFGFLAPEDAIQKQPGGRYRFKEIDVYEISTIPVLPANNDTRVLSYKSLDEIKARLEPVLTELREVKERLGVLENPRTEETGTKSVDPLKDDAMKLAMSVFTDGVKAPAVTKEMPAKRVPELAPEDLRRTSRDLMIQVLTGHEVNEPIREADQGH